MGAWVKKMIEPSPRQAAGRVHRKGESLFSVRSPTPPQAARNALAIAVHPCSRSRSDAEGIKTYLC